MIAVSDLTLVRGCDEQDRKVNGRRERVWESLRARSSLTTVVCKATRSLTEMSLTSVWTSV